MEVRVQVRVPLQAPFTSTILIARLGLETADRVHWWALKPSSWEAQRPAVLTIAVPCGRGVCGTSHDALGTAQPSDTGSGTWGATAARG